MIQIKPSISFKTHCPVCKIPTTGAKMFWQGIHTAVESRCSSCKRRLIHDLPVGQATMTPYTICPEKKELWGEDGPAKNWFGKPFVDSVRKPEKSQPQLAVSILAQKKQVIILNCLDYLYGHSLLKLLNAQRYLSQKKYGVVVIIPQALTWLVPEGVAEIWTSPISFQNTQKYYPSIENSITEQLTRFSKVALSETYSHPMDFSIETFSRQPIHNYQKSFYRITFIWREDRPWFDNVYLSVAAKKLRFLSPFISHQKNKVISLFSQLKKELPKAQFTVAGLGKSGRFPAWIDDERVEEFSAQTESQLCQIYSESRVVVGVHGSSMLLPSAHAGGAISLLPDDRLGNYAEDLLYQQPIALSDHRLSAFFYRYLPISTNIGSLGKQITSMIKSGSKVIRIFSSSAS